MTDFFLFHKNDIAYSGNSLYFLQTAPFSVSTVIYFNNIYKIINENSRTIIIKVWTGS